MNKRYRQQNGTGQMETDGNKTEHIEASHQLDETRKTKEEIGKKRDGKGMRTGGELDGTGRGRIRYGDVNGRDSRWERDVNGAGAERDGNRAGRGLNGTEQERDGIERC